MAESAASRPAFWPVRAWLLAQAVIYASASWTTVKAAVTTTDPVSGTTLDQGTPLPGLRELVLVVGLVSAGAGAILVPRAVRYGRGRDVLAAPRRLRPVLPPLGRVGAVSRGLMFLLPGAVLVAEAWSYRPGSFGRVGRSVHATLQEPWGRVLLGVAAAGLAAFALYELAAAAYRREPAPKLPATPPAARVRPLWRDAALLFGAAAGLCAALAALGLLLDAPGRLSGRGVDQAVVAWSARHRTPVLTALSAGGTATATSMTCITVTAVVAVVAVIRLGRWREAVVLVLAGTGQLVIAVLAAAAVDRPPPAVAQLDPASSRSSFPSVHTGAAVALYGCLAVIVLLGLGGRYRWWPAALAALLVAVAGLAGVAQVYRGTSFPSDVLAAAAAAAAWVAAVVTIVLVPRARSRR